VQDLSTPPPQVLLRASPSPAVATSGEACTPLLTRCSSRSRLVCRMAVGVGKVARTPASGVERTSDAPASARARNATHT
jgi:hypothetical protein